MKIFVSYSHKDAALLDELLDFLKGLEDEGVEFWTDRKIRTGELWDVVIKANLQDSAIVLALVSQAFLDSRYCKDVEIAHSLAQQKYLFPVILSACEWQRHEWLKNRQFLPTNNQTVEVNYATPGLRKDLFLKIRQQLRDVIGSLRPAPVAAPVALPAGQAKVEFCRLLREDWKDLADVIGIPLHYRDHFAKGDEGRGIWEWLEVRKRLAELPGALRQMQIRREDLAVLLDRVAL